MAGTHIGPIEEYKRDNSVIYYVVLDPEQYDIVRNRLSISMACFPWDEAFFEYCRKRKVEPLGAMDTLVVCRDISQPKIIAEHQYEHIVHCVRDAMKLRG